MHALGRDAAVGLHLPGDRERIAGGALHGADALLRIVVIEELEGGAGGLAVLDARDRDAERHQVMALRLEQLGMHRGDEEIARNDFLPLDLDRFVADESQLADGTHDIHVARIAKRLVLHDVHLALIGERHGADPAAGVEGFQGANRLGKVHRLELAQRLHLHRLPAAQDPGRRGVVVERAFERIDNLVVERRLRLLRQSAHVDLDLLRAIQPPDALGGKDVHHARRETAIRNH